MVRISLLVMAKKVRELTPSGPEQPARTGGGHIDNRQQSTHCLKCPDAPPTSRRLLHRNMIRLIMFITVAALSPA